ncbi:MULTISPECIES: hypothetical protein [unclassified Lysinibacillus]|uniref:hypothetical protein n=1 Tax=unclassified Lysinibacillus TaxID=2636778 RepID=UPI0020112736|nr:MULTISPECIES: hypothetical protein [unclassified Lysinibacillus]MCL1698355.1 hypothetical protein [Lysinibacillus sp. BPa_S21]MCL1702583.1 hypothetical protein [Lysinibacillus sp. Bpr_S20]
MKKLAFVVILLFVTVSSIEIVSASSVQADEQQELSIVEAIELANPAALKWDKSAQLLMAINIDLDKPWTSIGSNGKRKNWNILFGVPDTNKSYVVTIHEGKIDHSDDYTVDGTSPYPKKEFIQINDIKYDSPEMLKKARSMGYIYPGKDWGKGYNFMLSKDTERDIPLLIVIGWNNDQTKMEAAGFNASTGEYIQPK